MPDRLVVSPEGLFGASIALRENAGRVVVANEAASAGDTASALGAARVATAIAAFSAAYAVRIGDHGRSAAAAGASYTDVDDDGAAAIGSVSV